MSRNIEYGIGEFYHIYNRGTEKRKIFTSTSNYNRFLALLYICNGSVEVHLQRQGRTLTEIGDVERGELLVDICAYCLMPNHFHLLLRERRENGISQFMQKLITAYTMYFNKLNDRNGVLFQGRYKSKHLSYDQYLKYVISYIHLNPISLIDPLWEKHITSDQKRTEDYLYQYKYSSYLDFLYEKRLAAKILNREALPDYFATPQDFKRSVSDFLSRSFSVKVRP